MKVHIVVPYCLCAYICLVCECFCVCSCFIKNCMNMPTNYSPSFTSVFLFVPYNQFALALTMTVKNWVESHDNMTCSQCALHTSNRSTFFTQGYPFTTLHLNVIVKWLLCCSLLSHIYMFPLLEWLGNKTVSSFLMAIPHILVILECSLIVLLSFFG